jgi:hypothetical protein
MMSKGLQFGVVGAIAFVVVGFVLPRVVTPKRGEADAAIARNTRALAPGGSWRPEEDIALGKRLHDIEPDLTPIALWRCEAPACGFEGRYMVFAAVAQELPAPRLESLLDAAAQPINAQIVWPAFPDTQAQGFRYPQGVYYVVSQSDRAPGAAATMVAGELIDQVAARVVQARAEQAVTPAPESGPVSEKAPVAESAPASGDPPAAALAPGEETRSEAKPVAAGADAIVTGSLPSPSHESVRR